MFPQRNPFKVLRFRDFRLLWSSLLVSLIGSQMQIVAVTWHVYLLTKSPLSLGIIGLARFIPLMFVSLIGGIAADRFDRRKIILISQAAMTLSALILAVATFTNNVSANIIYFSLAISSFAAGFDTPARQSLTPQLIPKKYLVNAIGLNTTLWQTAMVLGPSLGGFAIPQSVSATSILSTPSPFFPFL